MGVVRVRLRRSFDVVGAAAVVAVASVVLFLPASASGSSPIVVANTSDSGPGSLRQAILDANASGSPSLIVFNIPTTDPGFNGRWFTIRPASRLPWVTQDGTSIDGSTEAVFAGVTNPSGPEVELNGSLAPGVAGLELLSSGDRINDLVVDGFVGSAGADGIGIGSGSNNVVTGSYIGLDPTGSMAVGNNQGVGIYAGTGNRIGGTTAAERNVISGNAFNGIEILTNGNVVEGNYVGTDASGTVAIGNGQEGIGLEESAGENVIGGSSPGAGNVSSGNAHCGVWVAGSGNLVQGNYLGTDVTGTMLLGNAQDGVSVGRNSVVGENRIIGNLAAGNGNGVAIRSSNDNVIQGNWLERNSMSGLTVTLMFAGHISTGNLLGGTGPGEGNVISGNQSGISLSRVAQTTIQGNLVGTDASGSAAFGNGFQGILVDGSSDTLIGGTTAAARNVVSGNRGNGISIANGSSGTVVRGNYVGTDKTGSSAVPNAANGIAFWGGASQNSIGGSAAGAGNVIAENGGAGIVVADGTGNAISGNSVFSNAGLGIDLGGNSVTQNDPGDSDAGPNNLQNFPVLASADVVAGQLVVQGTIDTPNPQTVVIELFANAVPVPGGDPSGYGEGAVFLGTATPNASGSFTVPLPAVASGTLISATATDAAGNTSEFAQDVAVTSSSLSALTTRFVQGSSNYQRLKPQQKKAVDRLVTAASQFVTAIVPRLSPAQRAALLAGYNLVLQGLVRDGWLTAGQAAILINLANGL
jgi:parallel beta-helix repeat protein